VAVVLVNVLICISANVQLANAVISAIFQMIISQGKLKLCQLIQLNEAHTLTLSVVQLKLNQVHNVISSIFQVQAVHLQRSLLVDIELVSFSASSSSKALCTFVLDIFQAGTTVTDEAGSEPLAVVVDVTCAFLMS
jgi:hypothetical protein